MMAHFLEVILPLWILSVVFIGMVDGRSNGSSHHLIRSAVLDGYDKEVRPPGIKGKPLNIEFGLRVTRLSKVNSKAQLVTVDTWVIIVWNNTYLTWKKEDYGGEKRVRFNPTEVWVPDIALTNNGDDSLPFAGGRSKFLTNIVGSSDGRMVWSGPASFKLVCDMSLAVWPFDKQNCEMQFSSLSYGNNELTVTSFKTKNAKAKNFVASGDWDLKAVKSRVYETDNGNCCPYNFTEIGFNLQMSRRYQYHMFYLVGPCLILAILSLIGFCIPSESGERIGFITTLLLAMMVFLLLVPDALPESSESIPVLGIFMMSTMVMITAMLLVTIGILNCYHRDGHPPKWVQTLFCSNYKPKTAPALDLEMKGSRARSPNSLQPASLESRPSSGTSKIFLDQYQGKSSAEMTYQDLSVKLDKIFFGVFTIITAVMFSVLLTTRD